VRVSPFAGELASTTIRLQPVLPTASGDWALVRVRRYVSALVDTPCAIVANGMAALPRWTPKPGLGVSPGALAASGSQTVAGRWRQAAMLV
jgi:hypothetical protein